jgi:hypothetical protein
MSLIVPCFGVLLSVRAMAKNWHDRGQWWAWVLFWGLCLGEFALCFVDLWVSYLFTIPARVLWVWILWKWYRAPLVLADLTARHERVCRSVIQLVLYRNPFKGPFACF